MQTAFCASEERKFTLVPPWRCWEGISPTEILEEPGKWQTHVIRDLVSREAAAWVPQSFSVS